MRKWLTGLWLISVVLAFTRLELVALIGFLLVIALAKRRRGLPQRLVWTYLIFFSLICALYELAWLAKITVSPTAIVIGLGVVSLIYVLMRKEDGSDKVHSINMWPAIVIGILVCLFVNIPIIQHPSAATVVRYAAKTGDDINHINMIEVDRVAEGYVYSNTAKNQTLMPGDRIGYPQGWHINGAILESLFSRLIGKDTMTSRAFSYLLYKTLWIFLATFLGYQLIVEVFGTFFSKRGKLPAWAASFSALVLSGGLIIAADGYGFPDFIAAIGLFCAGLILACRIIQLKKSGDYSPYILGLLALTIAASTVWVLPGASLGLLTVVMLIYAYQHKLRPIKLWEWVVLVLAAVLSLIQAVVANQTSPNGSFITKLNLGGAVSTINTISVAILIIVCAALVVWLKPRHWKWLLAIIAVTSLEFFTLGVYQKIALGYTVYYAIKLAILSIFVLGLVLLAAVASMLRLGESKAKMPYRYALFIIAVLAVPLALRLDLRQSAFPLKNSEPISQVTAEKLLATSPNASPELVFRGANANETYLATKLWSEIRPYNNPTTEKTLKTLAHKVY